MVSSRAVSGIVLWCLVSLAYSENVFEAMRRNPELSQFSDLVNKDETAKVLLTHKKVTVFAPINSAVEKANLRIRNMEDQVASYHILIQLAEKSLFPTSLVTFLSGAAPLYLSHQEIESASSFPDKVYFVNNAKIIKDSEHRTKDGHKQILYIIDEVLEPYVPNTNNPPDAFQFLNQPGVYNIQESLGAFASRVRSENEGEEFEKVGNHTFFLPVGIGDSENINRLQNIDSMIIRGHVIPNQVLFTRTMGPRPYMTDSYTSSLKVEISLVNSTSANPYEGGYTLKAKSNTLQSDNRHKKGVVLSKIVRANIPVKNGVVHLIENPLMIIDTNVWQFIKSEEHGRLSKFMELISYAHDFRYEIQSTEEKTIFAPNNEAIERLGIEKLNVLKNNASAITALMRLHMVQSSVSSDDVRSGRINELETGDDKKRLYFRVIGEERNRTLTVQGGGVNAKAVQADIGATDGIVHIIDRVLGMPYFTVYETLKETESDLNETYQLSKQDEWNKQLAAMDKSFTFFAPSNDAWEKIMKEMPTAYKQLKMGLYPTHTNKILDRHLIVGKELSLRDLMEMEDSLQLITGVFKMERGPRSDELYVVWEGFRAKIVRPDVKATNGIIHIIDHVMMKNRDLIKSSTTVPVSSFFMTMVSTALMLIVALNL